MILISAIAKDLEKLILKTNVDLIKTKSKLDFYLKRKKITDEEYTYLVELISKTDNKEATK